MLRTFATHRVRRVVDLCGLWRFSAEGRADAPSQAYVPGCVESLPSMERFRGVARYQTTVEGGGHLRFAFGGVSRHAKVWLDDMPLGEHEGAYTPFSLIASDVAQGAHVLAVEADNRLDDTSALHVPNDYRTFGGIPRPVEVQLVPDVFIEHLWFTPIRRGAGWVAQVQVQLHSLVDRRISGEITLALGDQPFASLPFEVSSKGTIEVSAEQAMGDVEAYTPASPRLYPLRAALCVDGLEVDDLIDRVGFRVVEAHGGKLYWNGEPFVIRGFNRHEQYADLGCAVPPSVMAQDIALMRDLGANAVRTCHYPNDERFLDLCDESGLLVWEEAHARGLSEERMRHPLFDIQSEQCIREMIESHRNHPSIFLWGLLNECADDTAYGAACYQRQFDQVRAMDASRPVTAACCHPLPKWVEAEGEGTRCLALGDVVSFNIYPKWYHDAPCADYLARLVRGIHSEMGRERPILISEIGAGGIYGFRSRAGDKWSEERQAEIISEQLDAVLAHEDVAGVFLWQFADCRVDEEWFYSRPRSMNNKGVVDEYRRAKLAYQAVRERFRTEG